MANVSDSKNVGPNCGRPGLKGWDALDEDDKMVARRLPASSEYTAEERKKHRYCPRCWFEEIDRSEEIV